jgi:hypothetical protein
VYNGITGLAALGADLDWLPDARMPFFERN